jgi:hypothetical protein
MGVVKDANGNTRTADKIKENRKEVNEYTQKDSLVQQHIFSTITDRLMLQFGNQLTGVTMWTEVKKLHEGKSALVKADMCKHAINVMRRRCRCQGTLWRAESDMPNNGRYGQSHAGSRLWCYHHGIAPRFILINHLILRSRCRICLKGSDTSGANRCSDSGV